jgi:hypothetical protein
MDVANNGLQETVAANITGLSRNSGRTLDLNAYDRYCQAVSTHGGSVLNHNSSAEVLGLRDCLFRGHQRFWMGVVNRILALDDAAHVQDYVDRHLRDCGLAGTSEARNRLYEQAKSFLRDNAEVNAPILIIGNPTFGPQQCRRGTVSGPKKFIKIMSRFFFVVVVDEYMSSQVSDPGRNRYLLFA